MIVNPRKCLDDIRKCRAEIDVAERSNFIDACLNRSQRAYAPSDFVEVLSRRGVQLPSANTQKADHHLKVVLHTMVKFADDHVSLCHHRHELRFPCRKRRAGLSHFDSKLQRRPQSDQLSR